MAVETIYVNYSVTQIEAYIRCPQRFKYQYVDGLSTVKTDNLIFGSSIHSALEFNFAAKIHTREDLPTKVIMDNFAENLESSKNEVEWESGFGAQLDTGVELVRLYMSDYAKKIYPLKVEQSFTVKIPGVDKEFFGILEKMY